MNLPTIAQRIAVIKAAIPGLSEEQEEVIRRQFKDDRYDNNLYNAINRVRIYK